MRAKPEPATRDRMQPRPVASPPANIYLTPVSRKAAAAHVSYSVSFSVSMRFRPLVLRTSFYFAVPAMAGPLPMGGLFFPYLFLTDNNDQL